MDDIFVARVMSTELHTVDTDTVVEEAAGLMLDNGIGSVVVTDDEDHLEGILTSTDFVRIVAERKPKDQTPVGEYMSVDPVTAGAQDSIQEAADAMMNHEFHHLPVVDAENRVIGMVTTTDLAAYLSTVQTPSPS